MTVNRYYSSTAVDTTLTAPVASGETTIQVAATTGFPTSYPFTLALGYDTASEELVNIVGASGLTLKIGVVAGVESTDGRGVDGTAAISHSVGEAVKHVISGRDLREAQEHIAGTTDVHGITNTANLLTTSSTLGASQIASNAVTTAKILDANVTTAKIADSAITSAKIADGTIATADIADSAITSAKIADGTVVNADISASAGIDWSKLAVSSTISETELGYLDGVTSLIQTQINNLIPKGVLSPFAGAANSVPNGWLLCNGAAVSRTTYSALFAVVGTTYGAGDNSSTFNLPDLLGRAPIGAGAGSGLTARTLGAKLGAEGLPAHNHDLASHTHGDDHVHGVYGAGEHNHSISTGWTGSGSHDHAGAATTGYVSESPDPRSGFTTAYTNNAGNHAHSLNFKSEAGYGASTGGPSNNTSGTSGSGDHGVMQPSTVVNYIIKF